MKIIFRRNKIRDYEAIKRVTEQQAAAREFFIESVFPIGGIGAEIGALHGQLSERILRIAKPRLLYLVDPWDHDDRYGDRTPEMMEAMYQETKEKLKHYLIDLGHTHSLVNSQILRMTSRDFYQYRRDKEFKLDFIYIDGSHEKVDIASDLEGAWEVVKPGGIIAGDDCSYTRYWGNNVEEAVGEFCQAKGVTWQRFPVKGHTDQFLIRR